MRDDLAGDAEHIADLDQAQKRQAFPFGGAGADGFHNVCRPRQAEADDHDCFTKDRKRHRK